MLCHCREALPQYIQYNIFVYVQPLVSLYVNIFQIPLSTLGTIYIFFLYGIILNVLMDWESCSLLGLGG